MTGIDSGKAFRVKEIRLASGATLENRTVCIAGGFLIVESCREDTAPTWYNLSAVASLREVSIEQPKRTGGQSMRVGFF